MNLFRKPLPDGRAIDVFELTFGRARIGVGSGEEYYDDVW